MTKRQKSSPYPHPPSAFVRALTREGWRRCDAEALAVVGFCLDHANDDDSLSTLARHAAAALTKEPVLAGAVLLFARNLEASTAARRLWSALPSPDRYPLARLFRIAADLELAAFVESEEEARWEGAG